MAAMPRGKKSRRGKRVTAILRRFIARLTAQFRRPPEELVQRAATALAKPPHQANRADELLKMRSLHHTNSPPIQPGGQAMADDTFNRSQPDRSKINMSEDYEVRYWTKHLNVSRDVLQRAVEKVGNSAAAVRKELGSSK